VFGCLIRYPSVTPTSLFLSLQAILNKVYRALFKSVFHIVVLAECFFIDCRLQSFIYEVSFTELRLQKCVYRIVWSESSLHTFFDRASLIDCCSHSLERSVSMKVKLAFVNTINTQFHSL